MCSQKNWETNAPRLPHKYIDFPAMWAVVKINVGLAQAHPSTMSRKMKFVFVMNSPYLNLQLKANFWSRWLCSQQTRFPNCLSDLGQGHNAIKNLNCIESRCITNSGWACSPFILTGPHCGEIYVFIRRGAFVSQCSFWEHTYSISSDVHNNGNTETSLDSSKSLVTAVLTAVSARLGSY